VSFFGYKKINHNSTSAIDVANVWNAGALILLLCSAQIYVFVDIWEQNIPCCTMFD